MVTVMGIIGFVPPPLPFPTSGRPHSPQAVHPLSSKGKVHELRLVAPALGFSKPELGGGKALLFLRLWISKNVILENAISHISWNLETEKKNCLVCQENPVGTRFPASHHSWGHFLCPYSARTLMTWVTHHPLPWVNTRMDSFWLAGAYC